MPGARGQGGGGPAGPRRREQVHQRVRGHRGVAGAPHVQERAGRADARRLAHRGRDMRPRRGRPGGPRRPRQARRAEAHRRRRDRLQRAPVHDRGRVAWACEGHGRRQLNDFLDQLTDVQRGSIEAVTADGARRVAGVVAERLPGAEPAVDPLHAVSWATGALDALRREARPARKGERPPRTRQGSQGAQAPAAQEPRGPQRGAGLGARGAQALGGGAVARLPAQGGAARGLQGAARRRRRPARPVALMGVPPQDPPVRGALEEGKAQAGGRPEVGRARGLERPRRGGEQQDQGGGQAGLRVQEHRQPDSARDAQVLGPQARATRQGGGVTPTHTNSRSLPY